VPELGDNTINEFHIKQLAILYLLNFYMQISAGSNNPQPQKPPLQLHDNDVSHKRRVEFSDSASGSSSTSYRRRAKGSSG